MKPGCGIVLDVAVLSKFFQGSKFGFLAPVTLVVTSLPDLDEQNEPSWSKDHWGLKGWTNGDYLALILLFPEREHLTHMYLPYRFGDLSYDFVYTDSSSSSRSPFPDMGYEGTAKDGFGVEG
jgi:hypothetical protein